MEVWILITYFNFADAPNAHAVIMESQQSCEMVAESESKMIKTTAVCYKLALKK